MRRLNGWNVFYTLYTLALIVGACVYLNGCAHMDLEQRASAVYGTYTIAVEEGARALQSPEIPDATKLKIQSAIREAKPLAQILYTALTTYRRTRDPTDALALKKAGEDAHAAIVTLTEITP